MCNVLPNYSIYIKYRAYKDLQDMYLEKLKIRYKYGKKVKLSKDLDILFSSFESLLGLVVEEEVNNNDTVEEFIKKQETNINLQEYVEHLGDAFSEYRHLLQKLGSESSISIIESLLNGVVSGIVEELL